MPDPLEKRIVTKAELQAGVKLKAGHPARLVLDGPVPDVIHVQLHNEHSGEVMKGVHYHLVLHDKSTREGVTDDEGFVFEQNVPRGSYQLSVGRDLEAFDPGKAKVHFHVEEQPRRDVAPRPPLDFKHVRMLGLGAKPARGMEGDAMTLRAEVMGGDGEQVAFRIHRAGEKTALATVEAKVANGAATAQWVVPAVRGQQSEHGRAFDSYDFEAECHGSLARSHVQLRGYRRNK